MLGVKTWDTIIVGGGVIGLALGRELNKRGARVLMVERGEPGREASHAAAGMLADADPGLPAELRALAAASAKAYPEFVHELEDESGNKIDLRRQGTIAFFSAPVSDPRWRPLAVEEIRKLEPKLEAALPHAYLSDEGSVDPRGLVSALLKAAKHRGIEIANGERVTEIVIEKGRAVGVKTERTEFRAPVVVNCAGAWAGEIGSTAEGGCATRPVKGQMLAVIAHHVLQRVVRGPEAYLVPRSDGRVLIGATLEDAGFDKRVDPETIQRLHQAGARLVPELGEARMHEAWAGLRPGTKDNLPILGATRIDGLYAATGHYRDGILLAPITARVMAQVIRGERPEIELKAFSPARFG
jgi:glycine oxidase